MDKLKIYTEYSPWFIPLCFLAGFIYAYVLYQKKSPWSVTVNRILFATRFILVSLLFFLLIGTLIKYFKNYVENPTVILAIDNSQSVKYTNDTAALNSLKNSMNAFVENLKKDDIKVNLQLLDKTIPQNELKKFNFDYPATNLSGQLKEIESDFENRNLAAIVMVSDGIYNQGLSPNYNEYNFPIFTVGLGDTIPRKDINIKSVLYNKISYQGNQFPIVAEIFNYQFKNQDVTILLKEGKNVLQKKTIRTTRESGVTEVEFLHSSEEKGLQHYIIEAVPLKGEFTTRNNIAHVYIDIIEAKENILIVALSPHPDIKAIKSALEAKENYEIETYIPGVNEYKENKYDVVIFNQIPDFGATAKNLLDKFLKDQTSLLFIVGNQSHLGILNNLNPVLKLNIRRGQWDNVTPSYNSNFEKFRIEPEEQSIVNSFPPVSVPFADFTIKENSDIVLYQKIGSVASNKPLLVVNNSNNKKSAIFLGDGLWEWRLTEYSINKNTVVFDKLISNLIQYLSSKEDKRRFRVYPIQNEFFLTDRVVFEAEIYNDIYEKVYGQKTDLKITDENGKSIGYSFVNSENNSRVELKGLSPGIYRYSATTTLDGKPEKNEGEFTIKELMLEAINTTANHQLLRSLSTQTKGQFYFPNQFDALAKYLKENSVKSIIHTNEEFVELIHLPWLFFVILALASFEWFMRRYKGGY